MIDIVVESALFCFWTYEDRVNANHPAPFPDHFDLVVADVALDIIIPPGIGVRNNGWLCHDRQNVVETGWIDVSQIDDHAERFTFSHQVLTELAKTVRR